MSKTPKAAKKKSFKKWLLGFIGLFFLAALLIGAVLAIKIDRIIVEKFEGKKWQLPSHVYARPLEFYAGAPLTIEESVWELQKLGYRESQSIESAGQYQVLNNQLTLFTRGFSFWDGEDKPQLAYVLFTNNSISKMISSEGDELPLLRLEPLRIGGIYPNNPEDRLLMALPEIPPLLIDTLIAVEDQQFYAHFGLSLRGIARAILSNIQSRRYAQGGSTITQQLVKNFYLNSERSLKRKALEAVMALLLEFHYSKNDIMETYLNEVFYGQSGQRAIHGVGLASQYYFRQPVKELEVHQIALLIGMIKGPAYYNPWRHEERALSRRNLVLKVLNQAGKLSQEDYQNALKQNLGISSRPGRTLNRYPALMDMLRIELNKQYKKSDLLSQGLVFYTSLDPQIQHHLEESTSEQLARIEKGYRLDEESLQSAAVVTRIGTGEIVAISGDRNAGFNGFNRSLNAIRPIGSLIKPITYLAALQNPSRYGLSTLLNDTEFSIKAPDNSIWSPKNYDKKEHGQVPLMTALAQSYNLSAANLGLDIGIDAVSGTLETLGVERNVPNYPSMLLGAAPLSPMDVSVAYHSIANDGFYSPLRVLRGVYTAEGSPLQKHVQELERRIDASSIFLLKYALQQVFKTGTARSAYRSIDKSIALAGKTGTTDDLRDSWIAAFGGSYSTVVWVGRDDNKMTPLTSVSGALPIWVDVMKKIEKRSVSMLQPDNINFLWVDENSGDLSAESCENSIQLPFVHGFEPQNFAKGCSRRAIQKDISKATSPTLIPESSIEIDNANPPSKKPWWKVW